MSPGPGPARLGVVALALWALAAAGPGAQSAQRPAERLEVPPPPFSEGIFPCSGCHDSDAARAHMKIETYDPTPNDPWSGDEQEACQACH